MVGARNANSEELLQIANISREEVQHGIVVISGGAKGVDTTAVEAALLNGGKAIVFPSEGLAKWVKRSDIRQYIMNGQLLLMSNQRHDAPFSGSDAMQRNKYIHAPSDAVLIRDKKRILPSISFLDGEYGYHKICLGVPTVIGGNGIESVIELPLTDAEIKALDKSAKSVGDIINIL